MKTLMVCSLWLAGASSAFAQAQQGDAKPKKPYEPPPIFQAPAPVAVTLFGPISQLRRDRQVETQYRQGALVYQGDSGDVRIPVRLRTRGIWRKKNCDIPPLLLNFTKDSAKKTLFARNDRLRLTLHCKDTDDYEQYILQEYNLYRVHRLLSKYSYDVRLARVTYVDPDKKDTITTRWGFFQEQDDAFTERLGVQLVTTEGAGPADLNPNESAFFGVFQYFVGNSDFSIRALHNVVLVFKDEEHIPVARDFDWSGAVNARYAVPNPILKIRTVTTRVMRGYCSDPAEYERVFALFKEKKDAIYALYKDELMGPLMKPSVVANTLKYFDEFYEVISDPKRAKRAIVDECLAGSA
jgi:hypothetical protein